MRRLFLSWLLWLCIGLAAVLPVQAHPHIWVDAKVGLVFNDAGELAGIRHTWTFDEAFSAWAVTGLDVDGDGTVSSEEMADLGADYVSGLSEYDFFTFAGEGDTDFDLHPADAPLMRFADGRVEMVFTLALPQPHWVADAFEVSVFDPEWYVALDLVETDPVELVNAPAQCTVQLIEPQQVSAVVEERLLSLGPEVTQLPGDLRAALRGAGERVRLSCGGVQRPETAVEAIEQAAPQLRSAPFSAPPTEIGIPLPRDGFFGWVFEVQRSFYQSLTRALGDLQTDQNAFWVLGTLSFLYGIFHAAGPGHGKVVISSYVLATEKQVSRGVIMSFASAMVQAVVAVTFVSILALALNLTSTAMSDAATWMTAGSYVLVMLMGLWLIVRHLFGWGHHHHHSEHGHHGDKSHGGHMHVHEHAHEDEHDGHHHMVMPEQTGGSFRDAAAVVLAVGLRPCSGALVVLVFALSAGVFAAGIASAFLMALGTALTVSVLASAALVIKDLGSRLSGQGTALAGHVIWWLELVGAFLVFGFGLILLLAMF